MELSNNNYETNVGTAVLYKLIRDTLSYVIIIKEEIY